MGLAMLGACVTDDIGSAAASGVAVTLYNLDTGGGYPGRTQDDGLAHFPDEAYEIGDREWFEDSRQQVTDLRNLHANALAQLDAIDPKGTQTAMRAQHHAVNLRCDDALKSFQTAVWPGVHLNLQLDPLLGTWAISPIPIRNTEDCGQVFQVGTMEVTQQVGPGHWRGTYSFRWDTSKADPACRFKFSRSGTVTVSEAPGARLTSRSSSTLPASVPCEGAPTGVSADGIVTSADPSSCVLLKLVSVKPYD